MFLSLWINIFLTEMQKEYIEQEFGAEIFQDYSTQVQLLAYCA